MARKEPGLREQKKYLTRKHIAGVATELFLARGFDNVTVAEVAEAASVSKMTVFNYFPRKEDLFLDRLADRLVDMREVIELRVPGESVVSAMRRYHHILLASGHPLSGTLPVAERFWTVLWESPALVSRLAEHTEEIQQTLADALIRQTGESTRVRLVAGLLAATVTTVFDIAVRRVLAGEDADTVRQEQVAVIDEAFDLLERGIGDYGAPTG